MTLVELLDYCIFNTAGCVYVSPMRQYGVFVLLSVCLVMFRHIVLHSRCRCPLGNEIEILSKKLICTTSEIVSCTLGFVMADMAG